MPLRAFITLWEPANGVRRSSKRGNCTLENWQIREIVRRRMPSVISTLAGLVALPSVFSQETDRPSYEACSARIGSELVDLGFQDVRVETLVDRSHCVIGTREVKGAARTVLLYSHFDIQPAGDADSWHSDPYALTALGGRLYGRGAADCKGGVVAHLGALRAVADRLSCNVVFVCEGSEEAGGSGLDHLIRTKPEIFRDVNAALILDGVNPTPGVPAIVDSLRGVAGLHLTVTTGTTLLHSGTFGGPIPDAITVLVKLLGSLWDEDGNTVLDAAGPFEPNPDGLIDLHERSGLLEGVSLIGSGSLEERTASRHAIAVIAADVPGLAAAAPVLRPSATAVLSVRTPPGHSSQASLTTLKDHLRREALWGAELAFQTLHCSEPFFSERGVAHSLLSNYLADAFESPVSTVRTGGSVPLCASLAQAAPEADIILFAVADETSSIHSTDESVSVDDLEAVITAEAAFLTHYGATTD